MWTGTETLAHNMLQEYDHPTGRYKISAVYRPLADEQTQRNNTFFVTLNYRCGSNDMKEKFIIPKEYVTRLNANGAAYTHDVDG
ncbi:hypothetical protein AAVH_33103 [Aphelenchoides avenae]|nr:hypothetical protein AAVH_33103 [Aphelenchus avenae]